MKIRILLAPLVALLILAVPLYAQSLYGEAESLPWSGYWWPLNQGELVKGYQGHPSPIEKYDLYTLGNYPGIATANARNEWYDSDVPNWYGICHGWANASILENYDFKPSASQGVFISVGDKKGLLAACHAEDLTQYESCMQSPEPFHRYLLTYIGEQGVAVAADLDASEEFWSYPIYRYDMEIISGQTQDQVICRIWHADDLGFSPDFEGTVEVEKTYHYTLEKDLDGNYIKGGGSWQGTSVDDHPETVWIPIALRPERLFLDYDTVKAMAQSFDDEGEGRAICPGHHMVMVYPGESDDFSFQPRIGETIDFNVALDSQSTVGNEARVFLRKNGEVILDEVLSRNMLEFKVSSMTGNDSYILSLQPGDVNSTGCCIHLYADYDAPFQHWFYGYPSGRFWVGCAGLIENQGNVALQVVGEQGLPAQLGQVTELKENGRLLTTLSTSATVDYFRDNKPQAVKICSVEPLTALCFSGDAKRFWGSVQSLRYDSKKLVVPWLTSRYDTQTRGELYLAQHSNEENHLKINYYKDDGTPYSQQEIILPGNNIIEYGEGRYPDGVSLNGWALVEAESEGLDGAVLRSEDNYSKDQLPLLRISSEWVIPHLAVGNGWQTTISLYNPNASSIALHLACYGDYLGGDDFSIEVAPFAHQEIIIDGELWGVDEKRLDGGWINISSEFKFAGSMNYRFGDNSSASLPLLPPDNVRSRRLPHLVCDEVWWTGIAFVNLTEEEREVLLTALSEDGTELETVSLVLGAKEKYSGLADALFMRKTKGKMSAMRLDQAINIVAISIFGTMSGENRISAFIW